MAPRIQESQRTQTYNPSCRTSQHTWEMLSLLYRWGNRGWIKNLGPISNSKKQLMTLSQGFSCTCAHTNPVGTMDTHIFLLYPNVTFFWVTLSTLQQLGQLLYLGWIAWKSWSKEPGFFHTFVGLERNVRWLCVYIPGFFYCTHYFSTWVWLPKWCTCKRWHSCYTNAQSGLVKLLMAARI